MDDIKLEFERNENVVIDANAPAKYRPSELGWIISGRLIETKGQSDYAGYPINTILYLVEYTDGSDMEIPAEFIKHRNDK